MICGRMDQDLVPMKEEIHWNLLAWLGVKWVRYISLRYRWKSTGSFIPWKRWRNGCSKKNFWGKSLPWAMHRTWLELLAGSSVEVFARAVAAAELREGVGAIAPPLPVALEATQHAASRPRLPCGPSSVNCFRNWCFYQLVLCSNIIICKK